MIFKRILLSAIFLCVCLSGCANSFNNNEPDNSPSVSEVEPPNTVEEFPIDLTEYDILNKAYLEDVFHSVIVASTWDTPEQIEPDRLVNYYLIQKQKSDTLDENGVSANELEKAVQNHFDVSTEHLRKSNFFDAEKEVYYFEGWGGAAMAKIVNAQMNGNKLVLTFDVFSGQEERVWGGKLTIEVEKENYKYISCYYFSQ